MQPIFSAYSITYCHFGWYTVYINALIYVYYIYIYVYECNIIVNVHIPHITLTLYGVTVCQTSTTDSCEWCNFGVKLSIELEVPIR